VSPYTHYRCGATLLRDLCILCRYPRNMTLSAEDSRKASEQVAAAIRADIADGTLVPGQKAPSVRSLAKRFGVAPDTANKAIGILRSEGLLYTSPGRGSFVRAEAVEVLTAADHSPEFVAISKRIDELVDIVRELGARVEELETVMTRSGAAARPVQTG
jgi:GntR family transcriptional regulator